MRKCLQPEQAADKSKHTRSVINCCHRLSVVTACQTGPTHKQSHAETRPHFTLLNFTLLNFN